MGLRETLAWGMVHVHYILGLLGFFADWEHMGHCGINTSPASWVVVHSWVYMGYSIRIGVRQTCGSRR
jgi:hypothetical protein